ncbi:MAG: hypothetical protein JWP16_136 [Alphaproteobacteria bacterium]|jgi:uncharacterized membrane protein|nr:hypothetical protein [Alphaproteobacteria bacterium]MDB5739096.1 hypothetical protein [Alphaproteobacteria bacterium]
MHTPYSLMHVVAASIALATGAAVIVLPKGKGPHRLLGITYVFAMLVANMAALMIYSLTGHFNLFHGFALLSLFFTLTGLSMPILKPQGWVARHVWWMSWSYLGLLAATANEALIHLPLPLRGAPRIIATGVGLAVVTGVAGRLLRPRLMRAARDHS